MKHLTAEELSAFLDQALPGDARASAERHMEECAECREALAVLAARDEALHRVLEHDPGEAYFESFPARVEDRIRAAGLRGAQARLEGGGMFGWLRSPGRLAMVGAAAAVIGGAGIVMLTARNQRPPYPGSLEGRLEQQARPAEPPAEHAAPEPDAGARDEGAAGMTSQSKDDRATRLGAAVGGREVNERATADAAKQEAPLSRAPSGPESEAASPSPRAAAPERLVESRRNAAGEDVPVRRDAALAPKSAETLNLPRGQDAAKIVKPRAAPAVEEVASGLMQEAGAQLCGQVLDPRGRPVAGAQVAITDLGRTATTDAAGRFCIPAPEGTHAIAVMAVGYEESRLEARAGEGVVQPRVTLTPVQVLGQKLEGFAKAPGAPTASYRKTDGVVDVFSSLPESLRNQVREAQRLFDSAPSRPDLLELNASSALQYEAVATKWERVVPSLRGPAALEARYRLAEARVRAWRAEMTPARARAATEALNAYLRVAPQGVRRAQATRWLAQIGR